MRHYGVKEVSDLSGVSIRTLHHYDRIGLLKPAFRTEAGYRHYGESELLRLQQILFYRELDFPLTEIQQVLDDPDFDLVSALQSHKTALLARRERIATLLETLDSTIHHLTQGTDMKDPKQLYEGLPTEMGTSMRQEAIDAYGADLVRQAEQYLLSLGKTAFNKLKDDFALHWRRLFDMRDQVPESEAVQEAIYQHYLMIRQFWGTVGQKDVQAEQYACLGDSYVQDERFTEFEGKSHPDFGRFMQAAMRHYAEKGLKA